MRRLIKLSSRSWQDAEQLSLGWCSWDEDKQVAEPTRRRCGLHAILSLSCGSASLPKVGQRPSHCYRSLPGLTTCGFSETPHSPFLEDFGTHTAIEATRPGEGQAYHVLDAVVIGRGSNGCPTVCVSASTSIAGLFPVVAWSPIASAISRMFSRGG